MEAISMEGKLTFDSIIQALTLDILLSRMTSEARSLSLSAWGTT